MCVNEVATKNVILFLEEIFKKESYPNSILTDNGPQFMSAEFNDYLADRGIVHKRSSIYHPETNGAVERFNKTLKDSIQLARANNLKWKETLQERINAYRMSPHSTTGKTPFKLFRGRMPNTRLAPGWVRWDKGVKYNGLGNWREREVEKQRHRKMYYDKTKRVKAQNICMGDVVRVKAPVGCSPF